MAFEQGTGGVGGYDPFGAIGGQLGPGGGGPYQPQAPAVDLNSLQNAIAQSQRQAQPPQQNGMTPDKVAQAYHAALVQVLRGRGRNRKLVGPPIRKPPPNYLGPPLRG